MITTLLLSIFSAFQVQAAPSPCTAEQIVGRGVVASRFNTVALGCVVQVTPRSKPNLQYREFWFDERGRMLVFSSIPGEDIDKATGTRTYFIFPRRELLSFSALENGDLSLRLATGDDAVFTADEARLSSFPGQFSEERQVSLDNRSGVELSSFHGILLDAGWKTGGEAYKDPDGISMLSDEHNHKCAIRNNEFFFYVNMYYSEPNLVYPQDAELEKFLSKRCPNLDLSSFRRMNSSSRN